MISYETGRGYLLFGDFENSLLIARKMSADILGCEEKQLNSHPDFCERLFDSFSIDDLRDLAQKAGMKPILSQSQIFILKISSIPYEVALSLSIFIENISSSSYFFLMFSSNEGAPEILRSRFPDISEKIKFEIDEERKKFWRKFLESEVVERLALAKDAASDKKKALVFLNELEAVMEEKLRDKKLAKQLLPFMEEINLMRKHLLSRQAYSKMIIEHIVLILPQF